MTDTATATPVDRASASFGADPIGGHRLPGEPPPTRQLVEVGQPAGARHRRTIAVPRGITRLSGPAILLVVWAAATYSGIVSDRMFPTPGAVGSTLADLISSGELQTHLWASLQRVLKGLGIGIVGGVVLALAGGLTKRGEDIVDSIMQIFKAIPNFALVPLLIVWMGIGEEPKVALIAMGTGMHIYINTYGAIRGVDNDLVEAASTVSVRRWGMVRHVILPGSVPGFLVGLRLATASAWLSLIFSETINAQHGVGFLMSWAQANYKLEVMVSILVVYAAIGLLSYAGVRFLERRLLAWRRGFTGA